MADIFISYTSSDHKWAFWIAEELKALGHVPHIHEWEIKGGDDIYAWMEQRHDAADHVLCVVSDAYLKAPYSTLERNAAIWQAAAKRPGFALFVAVKPCRLPNLIDHYRRCELFGVSDEEARARFRRFMQQPADAAPIAFPGEAFAVSNVPIRVPEHFLGRDDALAEIAAALGRYEGAITALHGLPGIGKTTLAAAYAERHRGDYRATWWIRAQTVATMRADLVGLGVRLKWVPPDQKEEPALAAVMDRLRLEGSGILLIYDNALDAEALRPFLPRGGAARVLVTSNAYAWRGVAAPVEIKLWPKEIGADYLVARTGRDAERGAAEALSAALGGLPLAHEQAAAYCERLDMSLADYHARFNAAPAKLLDDTRHAPAEYHDGLTVAKTFALAIEKAANLHPAAEPLIVHAAMLAPEPIPLYLFSEGREKLGEPLASAIKGDGLIEAVAALRAFALVDRETFVDERDIAIKTDCIRLHRLVRQVANARRDDKARADAQRALIAALATAYPDRVYEDPSTWTRARRLDPIALALVQFEVPQGAEARAAYLMDQVGAYRVSALGDFAQAHALRERALAIREQVLGPDHPETASSLSNLASLLGVQGDYAKAQRFAERALAIQEKLLGPEHADIAVHVSVLAILLLRQGDLAGARQLFERVLAINERALGPEHPDTARSLNNLANVYLAQGNLAQARPLFERSLAIIENVRGPDHRDTASHLNNLAIVLQNQGDFARARPLFERALAIEEKVHGADHHSMAPTLHNLGHVLQLSGNFEAARPFFERALAINENFRGPLHPDTAMTLNGLAGLVEAQGDIDHAILLVQRALAIIEKALGPAHANVAVTAGNLGRLLCKKGSPDDAEQLFARAIEIGQKALGSQHQRYQRIRGDYARLLLDTGRLAEALSVAEAALAVHAAKSNLNHPWTKDSARVTADALDALGRGDEAKEVRERYGIATTTV